MNGPSADVSPRQDGDLMFLTDTAYHALLDNELLRKWPSKGRDRRDGLFLERLDSFIEGQLKDIESFATREQRPLEEVRKLVAIPHAKYIFSLDPTLPPPTAEASQPSDSTIPTIRDTLIRMSGALQLLHSAAGLDSLLLVVSPRPGTSSATPSASVNPTSPKNTTIVPSEAREASWIGGTELGKEFWMGLKGGGVNGARAFRVKCQMRHEADSHAQDFEPAVAMASLNPLHSGLAPHPTAVGARTIKVRSVDVKTELNAAVRHALRSASGNPSAEMRWTKPTSLEDLYDVRLMGWPPSVSVRNPSNNSLKDNRLLLDLVQSGQMKFVKKGSLEWVVAASQVHPSLTDRRARSNDPISSAKEKFVSAPSHPEVTGSRELSTSGADSHRTTQQPSHDSSPVGSLQYPSPPSATESAIGSQNVPVAFSTVSPRPSPSRDGLRVAGTHADGFILKRSADEQLSEGAVQDEREVKRAKPGLETKTAS